MALEVTVATGERLEDWRAVHDAIIPTAPLSLADVAERATYRRLTLAYADGVLVGNATVRPPDDPDRVATVIVRILPEHRRRGYGAAYLASELAAARALAPTRVETVVLASNTDGLRFAAAHGFVEHRRYVLPGDTVPFVDLHLSAVTPTIDTARLRLRPFTEADGDALFALQSDARVLEFWDSPPWTDRARADAFIERCRAIEAEGDGARVVVERDGEFLGWCSLTRWNPTFRSASLGYCLGEAAWGHGYMTEAAGALLRWGFSTFDLNRVQAETDTRNVASARVLEKLGFRLEGTLREDCVVDGVVSDSWVFGLLRREWTPA